MPSAGTFIIGQHRGKINQAGGGGEEKDFFAFLKFTLDNSGRLWYYYIRSARDKRGPQVNHGGIAQLGERLNGIQEVSGSIPLISTKKDLKS